MWSIALRDLQFRRRRFVIAVIGTALVFAMALVLSGLAGGFRAEVDNTVGAIGADAWITRTGVAGPVTAIVTIGEDVLKQIATSPGVTQADPLIITRQTIRPAGEPMDVNLIGHRLGGLGTPPLASGRAATANSEAVLDQRAKVTLGTAVQIAGQTFTVVGLTKRLTFFAGIPNVYISINTARTIVFRGAPLSTAIVTKGIPTTTPPGFVVMTNAKARADMLRPNLKGITSLDNTQLFLWIVAAIIIGAVTYLTTLERTRDFAVLKAVGASSGSLFGGLAMQSILIAIMSGAVAASVASFLTPMFPMPVAIPSRSFIVLPIVAIAVGLLASLSGLRRAVTVDPALAFGG